MLWGQVSDVLISARLLIELSRHQGDLPLVVLTDKPLRTENYLPDQDPPRDFEVLPREGLSVHVMRSVMLHFGARRHVNLQQPTRLQDPLTGLNNRQHLREQLSTILALHTEPTTVALLLIDVDQLKKVNVSYGQGAGDALIQMIAERLQFCLLPHQRLARVGGNEFAAVLHNPAGSVEAEAVMRCELVVSAMAKPFMLGRNAVKMNVSLGLAITADNEISVDNLFGQADMAMRVAKLERGNTWQRYTFDMTNDAQKELMKVIAEGAETRGQVDFLREYQCDQVQGYFFSRPVTDDNLLVLLELERERGFESTLSREVF